MKAFGILWGILLPEQKQKAFIMLALVLISGLFESIGLGMLLPLVALMTAPEVILTHGKARHLLTMLGNPGPEAAFFIVLVAFVALYFLIALYRLWLSWYQSAFLTELRMTTASRLYESYLYQPWSFHMNNHSSGLVQNIIKEVEILANYGFSGSFNMVRDGVMIIIVMAIFFVITPVGMIAVAMLLAPFAWGFATLSKYRTRRWSGLRQKEERDRLKCIQEGISAVKEVRLLGCEDLFFKQFQRHSDTLSYLSRRQSFLRALPRPLFEMLAIVSMAIVIISLRLAGKELAVIAPVMGLFAVGVIRLMPAVNSVLSTLHGIRYAAPSINIVSRELRQSQSRFKRRDDKLLPFKSEIELDNIVYAYKGDAHPVLCGINVKMPRGSFTAFIGKTGAGKSTLLHVILGLLEPTGGSVRVDGQNIKAVIPGWQRQIGYVGQNIVMMDDTLRRNIALGVNDNEVDEAAIWRAIEAAQLADFVSALPNKLDTVVGEHGARISGGEKQRIGIARALYANASVLVLDEVTSSLDEQTEASIVQVVEKLKGSKTIIMVTHRMGTIAACDQVIQLSRGKVKEALKESFGENETTAISQ